MDTLPPIVISQPEWREKCAASSRLDASEEVFFSLLFAGKIDAYVGGTHVRVGSYDIAKGEGWWHP